MEAYQCVPRPRAPASGAAAVVAPLTASAPRAPPRFYEEIGAGGFSNVYKGRKRRSVEFVAIRRVEKVHQPKVTAEVQAMHALRHDNVTRFFAWFATTNHLWLVTEYCAGGDLRRLLQQDGAMPEETILSFGVDLLAALLYVH